MPKSATVWIDFNDLDITNMKPPQKHRKEQQQKNTQKHTNKITMQELGIRS